MKNFNRRSSLSGLGIDILSVPVNDYHQRNVTSKGDRVLTLPAAENVPIAVPIAAHAPNASGSDLALTPAMNPAAHPPAAALSASSVYLSVSFGMLGPKTYFTDV